MTKNPSSQRLLVYIFIDTSRLMTEISAALVNQGVRIFEQIIKRDPNFRQTLFVSVIFCNSVPLKTISVAQGAKFKLPALFSEGTVCSSQVWRELKRCVTYEMKPGSSDTHRGESLLILYFSDGQPDKTSWQRAYFDFLRKSEKSPLRIITFDVSPHSSRQESRQQKSETMVLSSKNSERYVKYLFQGALLSALWETFSKIQAADSKKGASVEDPPSHLFDHLKNIQG